MLDVLMPEVGLQASGVVAVIGELVAAGVAQHVGMDGELTLAATPARATILAKPAVVNGASRSLTKTKGELRWPPGMSARKARISSPCSGWVLGVPFLTRRT